MHEHVPMTKRHLIPTVLSSAICVAILASSVTAVAQPSEPEREASPARVVAPPATAPAALPSEEPRTELRSQWYGWQTLLVDGAVLVGSISVVTIYAGKPDGHGSDAVLAPLFAFPLGGPVVHWAHGRVGTGFGDLGIRLAAPILATFIGAAIGGSINSNRSSAWTTAGGEYGALVGLASGCAAAIAIDAAVLAREDVREPVAARSKMNLMPTLALTKGGGGTGGLAGTF
jgi:hypothetical protein